MRMSLRDGREEWDARRGEKKRGEKFVDKVLTNQNENMKKKEITSEKKRIPLYVNE